MRSHPAISFTIYCYKKISPAYFVLFLLIALTDIKTIIFFKCYDLQVIFLDGFYRDYIK